jgi:hypothetical protein
MSYACGLDVCVHAVDVRAMFCMCFASMSRAPASSCHAGTTSQRRPHARLSPRSAVSPHVGGTASSGLHWGVGLECSAMLGMCFASMIRAPASSCHAGTPLQRRPHARWSRRSAVSCTSVARRLHVVSVRLQRLPPHAINSTLQSRARASSSRAPFSACAHTGCSGGGDSR